MNGAWTPWIDWTDCSATCGSGSQSRSRTCTNPAPKNGGSDCVGDSFETIDCNLGECPGKNAIKENKMIDTYRKLTCTFIIKTPNQRKRMHFQYPHQKQHIDIIFILIKTRYVCYFSCSYNFLVIIAFYLFKSLKCRSCFTLNTYLKYGFTLKSSKWWMERLW